MNEKVATKISEIVADGITDIPQVRSLLRHYVMHDLCKDNPPNPNDRAYFPLDNDLRNHIYMDQACTPVFLPRPGKCYAENRTVEKD